MARNLSHAFASRAGERAAIAKFSQRRAAAESYRSIIQARQRRLISAIALVAGCGVAALSFHVWSSDHSSDPAAGRDAEMQQRAALRFGEIKIPVGRNTCTSMALDNTRGVVTTQSTVPCFEMPEAPPPHEVATDGGPGPAARAKAMSSAFKR